MRCEKCGLTIEGMDIFTFKDKKLCDECYLDLIIGVPPVDLSKVPEESLADMKRITRNWFRDRPNRHHVKYGAGKQGN